MQIDGNTVINIRINVDIANTILGALGKQPFEQVAPVIATIKEQADRQLQAMPQVAKDTKASENSNIQKKEPKEEPAP